MFGFPKKWTMLHKLIWLKAAALSSAVQKTVSGAILSIDCPQLCIATAFLSWTTVKLWKKALMIS